MSWRRIAVGVGAGLVVLGTVAIAGAWWWLRVPAIDSTTAEGMDTFQRVLNGDAAAHDEAISRLAGAIERNPDDARAQLWFALANMHGLIERRELAYAIRASRAFDRAVELDPNDTSAEGWRAFFAYMAAQTRGDDIDAARASLLAAAEADPRFTPFLATVALARMPLDSGVPQTLLEPLEALEDCGDGTSDSCRRTSLFPHGAEGYHATVGDLRVRLGDVDGGRRAYAKALAIESASTWPYRSEFETWIEGAEDRAALLTNASPDDDPPIFFASKERACAVCHEREAD